MTAEIRGRTALITGGAKRVGRAVALRLADEGIHVVFTYRTSAADARETKQMLLQKGVRALALPADLTKMEDCRKTVEQALGEFQTVDILINNASQFARMELDALDRDESEFEQQFEYYARLHMRAPFYLGMRLGLRMKRNGWGRIINLTDRVTLKGQAYTDWSLYLITKYGLYGASQVLAVELAPEVTVNSIAPGLVIPSPEFTSEDVEELRRQAPLKSGASAETIAEDVLFLIQSESKTGAVILTDGGASLVTY